jgi:O-6-methylguanine DNA methyltransferase
MNLVVQNTPPTQMYSLDSPSTDKNNEIMFSIRESDIGRMLAALSELEKVTRFLKTPNEGLDLPLDIRGARFQRRVWEALSTVRIGAVITYAALARRIGQPDAIPAVASACANSPLAIAISCQRVVRTNDDLAGYSWGMRSKRT